MNFQDIDISGIGERFGGLKTANKKNKEPVLFPGQDDTKLFPDTNNIPS